MYQCFDTFKPSRREMYQKLDTITFVVVRRNVAGMGCINALIHLNIADMKCIKGLIQLLFAVVRRIVGRIRCIIILIHLLLS